MASLECPACGELQDVVIDVGTPIGTIVRRECAEGHEFWIRVEPTSLTVLAEKPD
jgi:hypothetical protein